MRLDSFSILLTSLLKFILVIKEDTFIAHRYVYVTTFYFTNFLGKVR